MSKKYENYIITGNLTVESTGNSSIIGNLGIGTASPTSKLHIEQSGGTILTLKNTAGSGTSLAIVDSAGTTQLSAGASTSYQLAFYAGTNGPINFGTFGQPTSGRAGFSAPNQVLMGVSANNLNIGFGGGTYFATADADAKIEVIGNGTTSSTFGLKVKNSTPTTSFVVRDDGLVGIGTTSPAGKLDVSYTLSVAGNPNGTKIDIINNTTGGANTTGLNITASSPSATSNSRTYGIQASATTNTSDGTVQAYAITGTVVGTNIGQNYGASLTYGNASAGNIGLLLVTSGTVTTGYRSIYSANAAHMFHQGNVEIGAEFLGTTALRVRGSSGNSPIHVDTNAGVNIIYGSSTGDLGINTVSPNTKLDVNGDVAHRSTTPGSFSTDQNDFATTDTSFLRLNNTDISSHNLTGFAGGVDGKRLVVTNVGSSDIVLKDEDAGSSAANRMSIFSPGFGGFADYTLIVGDCIELIYDSTSSRWRKIN